MDLGVALIASVGAISLFTFLAVAAFADARSKDRVSFHRNETFKKLAEQTSEGGEKVLELMREEARIGQRRRLEGLKLGGLITTVVGIGVMVFLWSMEPQVALAGLIPLLVGLALLFYVLALAPKPEDSGPDRRD